MSKTSDLPPGAPMKLTLNQPRRFEFGFPHLDAIVLVEDFGDTVSIRASRDVFTEQRKTAFIHELASEGFIAESFRWSNPGDAESYSGIRWRVDASWLELPVGLIARAHGLMIRLQVGGFLAWATLLALFLHPARH